MIVKGCHFRLEYYINIDKNKDHIDYKLNTVYIKSVDADEDGIGFDSEGYYYLFSDDESYTVNDTLVYLEKYNQEYEYHPNKCFEEYIHVNWDIDDFGDDDEGWDRFHEANELENSRYENSLNKIIYDGFICSADEAIVNEVLSEIIAKFCQENEIKSN